MIISDDDVFMSSSPLSSIHSSPVKGVVAPPPTPVQLNSTGPFQPRQQEVSDEQVLKPQAPPEPQCEPQPDPEPQPQPGPLVHHNQPNAPVIVQYCDAADDSQPEPILCR